MAKRAVKISLAPIIQLLRKKKAAGVEAERAVKRGKVSKGALKIPSAPIQKLGKKAAGLGAKRTVGLYIGTNSVSVVELGRTLIGRPKLVKFGRVEITPAAEARAREERVVEAIQKVLDESGVKAREVILGLPPEEVTVRYFRMARLPRKEWAQGVRFEAKKYIPFKLEEIISDFQVVETRGVEQMEVIFAAAKKEALTRYISILQKAGLKAAAIEPAIFGLMRVFHLTKDVEKGKTTAIIDIDPEGANICIIRDKLLYLARSIGLARSPEEPARPVFENLLSELSLSFDYYKKQFPGETIKKLILCGEGKFEGWDELLTKELSLPVTVGDLRKGVGEAEGISTELIPKLVAACGLALRGVAKPVVEVNLILPKEVVPVVAAPLPMEAIRRIASAEVVVCGALLLVIYFGMFTKRAGVEGELNKVIAARPEVRTELALDIMSPGDLGAAQGKLEERLTFLRTSIEERLYWTTKLNELARVLPEGTWLTTLSMEERPGERGRTIIRGLTLEGGAFSTDKSEEMELVNGLASALRKDELFFQGFQELKLPSVKKGKVGELEVTNFTLTCYGEQRIGK